MLRRPGRDFDADCAWDGGSARVLWRIWSAIWRHAEEAGDHYDFYM